MKCSSCSADVKPIVAVDIDGTMGKYHEHFENFLCLYTGRTIKTGWDGSGNWEDYLELPRHQYQEAKLAYRQGGWKRWMPPYSHAMDLTHVAQATGAEVWVTTTRPYNRLDNIDPDTQEWLRRNNIAYDKLLYDGQKYEELARQVDPERVAFVLEDLPSQYLTATVLFKPYTTFMIHRPHNVSFRKSRQGMPTFCNAPDLKEAMKCMDLNLNVWQKNHA